MNKLTKLGMILCMGAVLSYAETISGKLIDATCYDSKATATSAGQKAPSLDKIDKDCAPTASTTVFAVHANGKVYKLDPSGNAKVASEMQSGGIKADKDGDVHITVSGTPQGDTLKADSVKGK
ncbi:MAG: hypothetical protein JWO19_3745 [Bryobacterales bacterium]|jgi:hypothetical protein|nr:hypothetical protein [Bryobacterales bacterium]